MIALSSFLLEVDPKILVVVPLESSQTQTIIFRVNPTAYSRNMHPRRQSLSLFQNAAINAKSLTTVIIRSRHN
jgi:hypothetical protein